MRHAHPAAAFAVAIAIATAACSPRPETAVTGPEASTPTSPAPELADARVADLQARMSSGETSAQALAEAYLARIAALDDIGPRLQSVIAINPVALDEARAMDEERAAGTLRGPLHGIPVLLKDNIDVAGMATTAGSLALAGHVPPADAPLVARLRASGVVILGKTNLSEWANFRSTRSTSGWSSAGGQTRNPHVLDRTPCGSSSGSGVAAAAGLAPLTVGTETDGSIICPAAVNGVVGIKPTVGLVSRHGIVPISPSQDTAGPMARSVADAAALLGAIAGPDAADPVTLDAAPHVQADYTAFLDPEALRGARIGVLRQAMGFHGEVDAVMERTIEALREAGAEVVDPVEMATWRQWSGPEFEVLLREFGPALSEYLKTTAAPHDDLAGLVDFNRTHAAEVMPWFGQELFEMALAKGPLSDPAYLAARDDARRLAGAEGIDAVIATHRLDAILTTAVSPAWTRDPVNGDHFLGSGYSAAAVAGYPSVTLPAGQVQGLPVGVVLMGPAWSEPRLIGLAHALELRLAPAPIPAYLPHLAH